MSQTYDIDLKSYINEMLILSFTDIFRFKRQCLVMKALFFKEKQVSYAS